MTKTTIGVVGFGLLGRGICACLLSRGYHVVGVTPTLKEHAEAWADIKQMLDELVEFDGLDPALRDSASKRLTATTSIESLQGVSFVIESVFEELALKSSVFDELERILPADTVIATNTSAIPIGLLQKTRIHPERFLGMHWADPAHATRFLELIRGEATSNDAIQKAIELGFQLGKDPTVCQRDVPGFIVNRIAYAMYREALHLVESGVADFETIDRSLRNTLGLWAASCGPFHWMDLTGGPALYARAMQRVLPTLSSNTEIPLPMADLASADAGAGQRGHFYESSLDEINRWKSRQRRHVWLIKRWLDAEFPLEEKGADQNAACDSPKAARPDRDSGDSPVNERH